jgi:hypothetical protein
MSEPASASFEPGFRRHARRVRARLLFRRLLFGAAFGAAAGGLLAAGAWWLRFGAYRLPLFMAGVFAGLVVAALQALRKRWSDNEVALYLDARLGSHEVIATAVEAPSARANLAVSAEAARALAAADVKAVRPRILERWHGLLPIGSAAAVWLAVIPLPPAPAPPARPPGSETVKLESLAGLERIEALAELGGQNAAQEERLKRLAAEAKKLREDLKQGLEKREALARVGKLRDEIAAEKLRFGDAANRAGLDAAVNELERNQLTQKAARALGEGDLVSFDAEMQRLASLVEKEDREAVKRALDEAAKAARERGAKALAEALERERKNLEEAESRMDALRELSRELAGALDAEGQAALGEVGRSGSPEAQRKLSEALDRALKRLTPEERKRLAEAMRRRASGAGADGRPLTREQLEEMARRLEEKGADARLEEQLRELARRDPSEDSRREQGLDDADRGGADAQRGLGVPMPMGNSGGSGKQPSGGPKQEQASGNGKGGPGSGRDEGQGDHQGSTKPLDGKELRSKADGKLLPGAPMHAATQGRAPARTGETANQLGTGSLGALGPAEVGAVEGAEIPEEYREQVGRYFEP